MKIENVVKIKIPNIVAWQQRWQFAYWEDSLIRKLCILPMKSKWYMGRYGMVREGVVRGRIAAIVWRHDSINLCVKRRVEKCEKCEEKRRQQVGNSWKLKTNNKSQKNKIYLCVYARYTDMYGICTLFIMGIFNI